MIKNKQKKGEFLHKNLINSYLDDEFYSFFTEEARISLKKVRKIGLKSFSLSGNLVSLKRNDLVSFESSLERDYINSLEFDRSVLTYCEQPLKIFYTVGLKKHYYVPDFYVKYNDERVDEIIEIKYKYDLKKNKERHQYKFKAAKLFCETNNLIFKIMDETKVRTPFMENSKFLLPYKRTKSNIDFTDVAIIEENLKLCMFSTPNNLIIKSKFSEDRKAELLYSLWFMIANDLVKTDFNVKLTMNSKIWI